MKIDFETIFGFCITLCSVPTLISGPNSVKSGLNPDQTLTKTRPNPDPILSFFRTGFTKTRLIRTLGQFNRLKATFQERFIESTHIKMWRFQRSFLNFVKNPDF